MNGNSDGSPDFSLKQFFPRADRIDKLAGDASAREFYRIHSRGKTSVAMVYPGENREALDRIAALTGVYHDAGIRVPGILDRMGDRVLVQEDVGSFSLQNFFDSAGFQETDDVIRRLLKLIERIQAVPAVHTSLKMDGERFRFEIDFFIRHFAAVFDPEWNAGEDLMKEIMDTLTGITGDRRFAHRDFHSRNIFLKDGEIWLVDYQDSLMGPEHYDAASLAFDSYIRPERRERMIGVIHEMYGGPDEQFYLTAYQRNIKALGTFGYQWGKGKEYFLHYIAPTMENLKRNPVYSEKSLLARLFTRLKDRF